MPDQAQHEVLIVDDEPMVRAALSLVFERQGISTKVAENGRQAIELLSMKGCTYCCVVLDLDLPAPNGFEIAQFVRDRCPGTPIIVISGYPDLVHRIRSANLGGAVKMILRKPVDTRMLLGYVHEPVCLRSRRDGDAPRLEQHDAF
jgi:DNA-binding response OmpR family regulator